VKEQLKEYDKIEVATFISYIQKLKTEKDKKGNLKNKWMKYKKDDQLVELFKKVKAEGLAIDGKHVTIQSTGVSFDYVAYKNKMLQIYPDTVFDIELVYEDDTFTFSKDSGKVVYKHMINNPFEQKESGIIGGYCVIKNKRGESLTLLSLSDINKHRKVAKTDYIWKSWFKEMCLKTVSKKACNKHCKDVFQSIDDIDNDNYDVEKPVGITVEQKSDIEKIMTIDDLSKYYHKHSGNVENKKDFDKAVTARKKELEDANK